MLYDCWRETARAGGDQLALVDLADGRRWTFRQLDAASEQGQKPAEPIAFPQGTGAEFVLAVLRAWRHRQLVCPLEPGQPAPALPGVWPANIAHFKTTSATTGTPRLVAFSGAQLMADARNIIQTMGLRPDWPNLGVISLAHSYGFSNLVLPLLLHGIPLVLVGAALPEAVRRAACVAPDLTLAGVPALWRTWLEAGAIPKNVRLAISAGAPLPLDLEHQIFASHALKIHNFYGSSECGGIAYDGASFPRSDGACAGSPMLHVQLTIAQDGCLEVRGHAVATGYWPEPSPNLHGGLFHTPDLAELVSGLVFLRGRAGDQINVAGRKVSPETIERVLATHPHVRECLVFGITAAEPNRGETIVACLSTTGPLPVSEDALKQFLIPRLPAWQVPRQWWFVDSLAANSRGKLSRADWRKRYLQLVQARNPALS
jgi:acyl-CoA synthetase (AMP-forming)/AMP-acid ligase II